MKIPITPLLFVIIALLTGCATSRSPTADNATKIPALSIHERAFWSRLLEADIIYLPEVHDNDAHHRLQQRVITGLHDRAEPLVVAMEMFNLDQQSELDRWQSGRQSLETLFETINWQASWGEYSDGYETILRACKTWGIPVVAMNAPKSVVRAVSANQPIAAEDRQYLPDQFQTPAGGLAFFKTQMKRHPGMTNASWDRYYAVQALWEQTMATTILALLKENPDRKVVVMLGRGHSDPRFGVPFYVAQKTEGRQIIVDPERRLEQLARRTNESVAITAMAHE